MENDSIAFLAGEVGLLGAALTPRDAEKNERGLMLSGKKSRSSPRRLAIRPENLANQGF